MNIKYNCYKNIFITIYKIWNSGEQVQAEKIYISKFIQKINANVLMDI